MTESICLALKTVDINSSDAQAEYYNIIVTTNTGKVFDNRTGYTWNNVNMKNLLGRRSLNLPQCLAKYRKKSTKA